MIGDRSRFLWVRNRAGDEVAAAFRNADGTPNWEVVARMQLLFRDLHANAAGPLPVALLDILSLIHGGWRHERPLMLHSGYRTSATNASLEGAARASLHLEGRAADFGLRGATVGDLAEAARSFSSIYGFMGVGRYPGFLHVDIGPRRAWMRQAVPVAGHPHVGGGK